jgi:hypothetical protein
MSHLLRSISIPLFLLRSDTMSYFADTMSIKANFARSLPRNSTFLPILLRLRKGKGFQDGTLAVILGFTTYGSWLVLDLPWRYQHVICVSVWSNQPGLLVSWVSRRLDNKMYICGKHRGIRWLWTELTDLYRHSPMLWSIGYHGSIKIPDSICPPLSHHFSIHA